jgi:hypothetical protein
MSHWKDSIMTHTEMCDEIDSLRAKVADLERRLSTVPEGFGPLIDAYRDAVLSSVETDSRPARDLPPRSPSKARAALTEKIAALQSQVRGGQIGCRDGRRIEPTHTHTKAALRRILELLK